MLKRLLDNGGGESVLHIDCLHQADAAWAVKEVIFLAERFELAAPVRTHLERVVQQVLIENGLNGGDTGGTGNGVAAKGGAVVARREDVGARAREHGSNGNAASQSLCHRHDIGHDIVSFPS